MRRPSSFTERATYGLSLTLMWTLVLGGSAAWGVDNLWIGPNLGDWNTGANWQAGTPPNASFNQAGVIDNHTTAILTTSGATLGAGVRLGATAAGMGGLRIENGGQLTNIAAAGETGAIAVGVAGVGELTVRGGGTISGTSLSLGGGAGSRLELGEAGFSGPTATLSVAGDASLQRNTMVIGRNVNFSVGGNLTLGADHILTASINHSSEHSPLKAAGMATLGGTLRPTFTGISPALGSKWTLVDATNITGAFASIDLTSAPELANGVDYRVITSNGGVNGRITQLSIEESLVLNVHRVTGVVSIVNPGTLAKTFRGYSITSTHGALTGTWNSLQNQSLPGWVVDASSPTLLRESNGQSGSTISGTDLLPLGAPYQRVFPQFTVDPDHLKFEYTGSDGVIIPGKVGYSGTKVENNLRLEVNPANGQVQLKNDSPYDIFITGYSVSSPSGSLQAANGKWFSLQDRGIPGWTETTTRPFQTEPDSSDVAEMHAAGSMRLTAGSGYSLGELSRSNTSGLVPDLRLEFTQFGNSIPTQGIVTYGTLGAVAAPTPGLIGDFNNDSRVDGADFLLWQRAVGTYTVLRNDPIGGAIGAAQLKEWRDASGPSPVGAVPEPDARRMVFIAALVLSVRMRNWHKHQLTE